MPTYSFEEIIENIRWAQSPQDVMLWINQVIEEKYEYCQFHLRLITEAARQKRIFFSEQNNHA